MLEWFMMKLLLGMIQTHKQHSQGPGVGQQAGHGNLGGFKLVDAMGHFSIENSANINNNNAIYFEPRWNRYIKSY